MQDAVDPGHRPWGEGLVAPPAPREQVAVEVVDVLGRDLPHGEMPEVRLQIAIDDGARVAGGGDSPPGGGDLEPVLEQIEDGARAEPPPAGLLDEVPELLADARLIELSNSTTWPRSIRVPYPRLVMRRCSR